MNGDGLEDFFVGGAYTQPGKVFLQKADGTFSGKDLVAGTKNEEDMQSVLFDADGDGDLDLLVAGGSSEFDPNSSFYRPRLYNNDGKGNFTLTKRLFPPSSARRANALPLPIWMAMAIRIFLLAGGFRLALFQNRVRSYILRNDEGVFTDVTRAVCPALEEAGLINAAQWSDMDKDGKPDLVVAADWAPIRMFKNDGVRLREITGETGFQGPARLLEKPCHYRYRW